MPVQLESHPEYGATYQLLQLFACGVYQDYLKRRQQLPELSDMQRLKLRHLTIVTMSTQTKVRRAGVVVVLCRCRNSV